MHLVVLEPFLQRRGRMLLSVLLGLMTVGANIGLMSTAGYLIAKAATHPQTILLLWVPIVSVRFFGISRAVFRYIERLISHDVTFRILTDLRTRLYALLEPRCPAMFSKWTMGKLMDTMMSDIEAFQNMFLRVIAPPLVAVLAAALSLAIVAPRGGFRLASVLLLGLTLVGLIFPVVAYLSSRRLYKEGIDQRALLSQQITDMITGMSDLMMADDCGRNFLSGIDERQKRLNTIQFRLTRRQGLFEGGITVTTVGTAWMMLMLAVPRIEHGFLTGVTLCVVILTALSSFEAVMPLSGSFGALTESISSLRRLQDIESWTIPAPDPSSMSTALLNPTQSIHIASESECAERTDSGPHPKSWHIQVKHVSFAYVCADRNVLTDITFDAYPGKHIAIVGQNGAGKSTLIQLLTRVWDVQTGTITIDGIDVRHMPGEAVRKGIAVVSPHAHVFHASIADNLRIAKPTANIEELQHAAQMAQLQEWIEQLPDGYDTIVGETAHVPSGGQRQRIGIARAILANPQVFLLDEPLESLDTQTAWRIQAMLEEVTRHKTAIWITHQLRTLGPMDEILVLHDGRIVERGQHAQLLSQMGRYKKMWDIEQNMFQ